MIRNPLKKCDIGKYKEHFMTLVARLIQICRPFTKSGCKSIKFHQPYHWYLTRIEIGCAAMEKSLERMLGETQKKPFKYTNSRFDVEVPYHICSRSIHLHMKAYYIKPHVHISLMHYYIHMHCSYKTFVASSCRTNSSAGIHKPCSSET